MLGKIVVWFGVPNRCRSQTHWDPARRQERFQLADALLAEVEDRGGERRVRFPTAEYLSKVFERPRTTRRDHRYRYGDGHSRRQIAVEPGLRSIPIDRRQQDFSSAAIRGLVRPFDGIACRLDGAAARINVVPIVRPPF